MSRSTSLQEAVQRVGLTRLQAILMMAQLRAKVLKGATFLGKADLLLNLALPIGFLASKLAKKRSTAPDLCFTRGMLMHVEHLVILGAIADISREHRSAVSPSAAAMHQAFGRCGPEIRHAIASAWKVSDILIGGEDEPDMPAEYAGLRQALICRWLDRPLPTLSEVDAILLAKTMKDIPSRVP